MKRKDPNSVECFQNSTIPNGQFFSPFQYPTYVPHTTYNDNTSTTNSTLLPNYFNQNEQYTVQTQQPYMYNMYLNQNPWHHTQLLAKQNQVINNKITDQTTEDKVKNLMKSMDYIEGKGLGKNLQGISTFVTPSSQKPFDKSGLRSYNPPKQTEDVQVQNIEIQAPPQKREDEVIRSFLFQCSICEDKHYFELNHVYNHQRSRQHRHRKQEREEQFACIPCRKDFCNFQELKMHSESESHVKLASNVATKGYPICEYCKTSFLTDAIYKLHLDSPKHKQKIEALQVTHITVWTEQNTIEKVPQTGQDSKCTHECRKCKITCIGEATWNDHLKSKSHILKVTQPLVIHPQWYCIPCKLSCTSSNCYQSHLEGKKHKKNAAKIPAKRLNTPSQQHPPSTHSTTLVPPSVHPNSTVVCKVDFNFSTIPLIDLNSDFDPDFELECNKRIKTE